MDGLSLGMVIGTAFGAMVAWVSCWLYDRRRFDKDYARIIAIIHYEADRTARAAVARLVPGPTERGTKVLKPPPEDRPTEVVEVPRRPRNWPSR